MAGIGNEGGVEPLKNSNTSGLKRVSGDNSAGMDAPTLNKLTETLIVDGRIFDLKWLTDINNDTSLRISIEAPSMASSPKRSNMINELITGLGTMDTENINSMSSLGTMMCKIMVLMIVATTDQRTIERENQLELSRISLKFSNERNEMMMKQAQMAYNKLMMQAWTGLATTATTMAVGAVAAKLAAPKHQKDYGISHTQTTQEIQNMPQAKVEVKPYTKSDYDTINSARDTYGGIAGSLVGTGMKVAQAIFGKKENELKADVKEKDAMIKLIDNLADSAGSGVKNAQKARDTFMSLMKQILQSSHSTNMDVIRNI
ncbi:MAG: hypothetical protein LBB20_02550 [Puniceicoccales bacterium]|jgi:hypothetical protein|nr:hypothetical protein [Puniceicoccales bacterium]